MKRILLIFIIFTGLIVSCKSLEAQQKERQEIFNHTDRSNFILFEGRGAIQKCLDKGVTPLIYSGYSFGGGLGYSSFSEKRNWDISASFETGGQYSPASFDKGGYTSYNIDIKTRYSWRIDRSKPLGILLFSGIHAIQMNRLRVNYEMFNAAFGYDLLTGIGFTFRLQREFQLNGFTIGLFRWEYEYKPHKLTVDYQFDIPVGYSFLRPTYVTIENFVDGRDEPYDVERSKFASIGDVVYLESNIGLNYHLRNQNRLRFGYSWSYYKIDKEYNPVQGAAHVLQIQFWFKTNHHE